MVNIPISEKDYFKLTEACDNILCRPDTPLEMVAIPWLHVINEVPFVLSAYADLFKGSTKNHIQSPPPNPFVSVRNLGRHKLYYLAQFFKCFLRSFVYPDSRFLTERSDDKPLLPALQLNTADVLIVTWLLNTSHLDREDDFYFSNLQKMLYSRGLTSLLAMRNQSGLHSYKLWEKALRKGPCARMLLPDMQSPLMEFQYIKRILGLRKHIGELKKCFTSEFDLRIIRNLSKLSILTPALQNLRLHNQVEILCRELRPSIVITLYEGHAWERCVWHAARAVSTETLCVGYQHTIIRKNAYSIRRSLAPVLKGYDPDLILTLGEVTKNMLDQSPTLRGVNTLIYGSHRKLSDRFRAKEPKQVPVFLVLPEAVESESVYLFDLALQCAKRMPGVQFIFRTHPVLPFDKVAPLLTGYCASIPNVEVSNRNSIEEDYHRSGYILYRGSSTVIYAILAGLKPYYFERPGEIGLDPIFELTVWRENIRCADELIQRFESDQKMANTTRYQQWQHAVNYCDIYAKSIRGRALDQVISFTQANRRASICHE